MIQLNFSERAKNFIEAADDNGNIKNNPNLLLRVIELDEILIKAGITTGAVYPFIGGTAFSHKFNFLNPSQYQITWNGGWVHDSNGILGNGVDTYGDTGFNPTGILSINSSSQGVYVNLDNSTGTQIEMGVGSFNSGGASINFWQIYTRTGGLYFGGDNQGNNTTFNATLSNLSNGLGMSTVSRISSNNTTSYRNTRPVVTGTAAPLGYSNGNVWIGAANQTDGIIYRAFSRKRIAFAHANEGILVDKMKVFQHDIYVWQRSMGRA